MNATTICAWCCKVLTLGDPTKPISHGICADCKAQLEREVA